MEYIEINTTTFVISKGCNVSLVMSDRRWFQRESSNGRLDLLDDFRLPLRNILIVAI